MLTLLPFTQLRHFQDKHSQCSAIQCITDKNALSILATIQNELGKGGNILYFLCIESINLKDPKVRDSMKLIIAQSQKTDLYIVNNNVDWGFWLTYLLQGKVQLTGSVYIPQYVEVSLYAS